MLLRYGSGMDLTPRHRALSIAAVVASSFSIGVAFGIGFPLTTLVLESWGESKWMIGLAGAAPALGILAAMPLLPSVIARVGTIPAMTLGALLSGLGFLSLAFVANAPAWIVVRIAMSACLAAPWLAGETWINLVAREETRGRVIALYAIAFFGGFTVGPLVLSAVGTKGLAPFFVGAFGTAIAALPIFAARAFAPDLRVSKSEHPFTAIRLAPAAMVAGFMSGFAETSYLSLIASVGLAAGLAEPEAIRLLSLITLGGIALQLPLGWLADHTPRVGVVLGLAIAFMVLSMALPAALAHPFAAGSLAFVLGGVILGFYSVGLGLIGEEVAADELASVNAAFIVLYQAGSIAGPIASGAAMSQAPVEGFVASVVALMLISCAAIVWLRRRHRQPRV